MSACFLFLAGIFPASCVHDSEQLNSIHRRQQIDSWLTLEMLIHFSLKSLLKTLVQVREKLGAQEAAKQAVDEQRKQAARGASPENPQYKAPSDAPSEAQAQPWPAWDRAVKVCCTVYLFYMNPIG